MTREQKAVLQSQLNSEKKTLDELKKIYRRALMDCEKKIIELSARTDLENIQAIVYQTKYQEAIKKQLEDVLTDLQSNSYNTVSDYLSHCYEDGYIGVMYDLHGQDIPLIMPMDQKAVTRAIQTDSKISKGLYSRMGEDVDSLKKSIRSEISRGIAAGFTWSETAKNLAKSFKTTEFSKAYNKTMRIVRTEGHRIQVRSAMDAQQAAKSRGADILKQWDATLDDRTRETHRLLDGQIRELDEPFEVGDMQADAPGMFGDPAEDCNCRCALLQRARWALDEEELNTLKERAEFFGLDKTKNFEEFKEKYLQACEKEKSKQKYLYPDTVIHKKIIESSDYRKRFNQISNSDRANRAAWKLSKEMLKHRSGTRYEDIAFINYATGKSKINKGYHKENTAKPNKPMMEMLNNSKPNTIIAIHNHPGSSVPSLADLMVCLKREYKFGLVACHDGKIYKYSVDKSRFNPVILDAALDKLEVQGYNEDIEKMFKDSGVTMEVL